MDASGRRRRHLLIAVAAAVAVLAALVSVGRFGLVRGSGTSSGTIGAPAPAPSPSATRVVPPTAPSTTGPRAIPQSTEPEVFARRVANGLFTWETASGYGPVDYAQAIVDVGDPTGNESAALASDVRSYLPTTEAWAQLRTFQTRQWLTIDEASVPAAWADAVAQAAPGQLLPGTIAYTITGTRHRTGTWGTDPVDASRPVAFTVFLTCGPSFDSCRLLRLSQLDNPLR